MIIFFDEQTLRDATSVSDFYEKIHIEKYQIKSVTQMFMNEEQCEEMREIYEKRQRMKWKDWQYALIGQICLRFFGKTCLEMSS